MYMHQKLLRLILFSLIVFTLKLHAEDIVLAEEADFDRTYKLYGNVLRTYVKDGLVNYKALKSKPNDLNSYLTQSAGVKREDFEKWTEDEQLAFLINLYNAQTLKLIIDNYPVQSIQELGDDSNGPWDDPVVNLFGNKISLNNLENELVRKNFKEPRIHFALVCAARGCPPLLNKPYTAAKLDAQLESQTHKFLSDQTKNYIDAENGVLRLSPIFLWYAEDFRDTSDSLTDFIGNYFDTANIEDYSIEYTEYDWSLNEISGKK